MKVKSAIYQKFLDKRKKFAVLVDPDKYSASGIKNIAVAAETNKVDFLFFGGSLLTEDNHDRYISIIKDHCSIPVLLFPGSYLQLKGKTDGILLLSLISGRNPDMLIGKHVIAAPYLRASNLEILPTGYMLIESGRPTTVSYMSNSTPIPSDKDDIAACTAMAGEMLGLKLIYLDAGSGALHPVSSSMIGLVRKNIGIPLIVGGGIKSSRQAITACNAGADVIVVGNAIEHDQKLIGSIAGAIQKLTC
jgi:phosphoglycerol geranylgeranyltransferase